ncbi:MAG: phospholipid carrier-dependent glycosyltransferase [Lentisphaerae bacterium]|nr:phospholipid carrier-dependent glycosyltransferase [Lentisphaerota bacterium]MBQ4328182.1 glycosyltransferase family 39 protein [Lentisphaeria bacterium]
MKYFGWIFLFFIVMFIIPLASRPMIGPEEFAEALPAMDMVKNSYYAVVPRAPETPPMTHWVTAASYNLFGINSFAARLPSALAAGLTAILIALLVQQHLRDEKLAALSATVYLSLLAVFFYGTVTLPVMFTVMAMAGSLGTIFLALQEVKFNRRKFLLCVLSGLFASLAILSGGIYSLLIPVITALVYIAISGKWKDLLFITLPFLICAAAPVLPWILQLALGPAEMLNEFLRFKSSPTPWYNYLLVIIAGLFPVWILIPASLMTGKDSWKRLFNQPLCKFACCAAAVPLVYALAFRNTELWTMQIAFPALAILTALGLQAYFNTGGHHRSFDWMLNLWATLLVLTGLAEVILWFFPRFYEPVFAQLPFKPVILLSLGVVSLLGGGTLLYSRRGNWRSRLYLFFFSVAILPLGFSWSIKENTFMPEAEFRMFIEVLDIIPEKSTFYTGEKYVPVLQWCTGEKVNSISCVSDIPSEAGSKPVYVIVENDSVLIKKFPAANKQIISGRNFSCIAIAPATDK